MGQKTIIITIRVNFPADITTQDQAVRTGLAEQAIDEALQRAGLDAAIIAVDDDDATPVERLTIEAMPTIADLLSEEED